MQNNGVNTIKIGAVVLASILGVWGAAILISGTSLSHINTYYVFAAFDDATGLSESMDVKAAGKTVGYIEWTRFDDEERITRAKIRISDDVTVYRASRFVITQDELIGGKTLSLVDPPRGEFVTAAQEGDTLEGTAEGGFQAIIKRADQVLARVDLLLSEEQLGGALMEMTDSVNLSLAKVDGIVDQVDGLIAANSKLVTGSMQNIQAMSGNFLRLSANLEETSIAIRDLSNDPHNREQLNAVLANLNAASASLAATSANAEALSGDTEMNQNIRDTLRLTKETLEETKKTVTQFQGTLTGVDTLLLDAGGLVKGASSTLDSVGRITNKLGGKGGSGKEGEKDCADCGDGKGLQAKAGVYLRGVDYNANRNIDGRDRVVLDAKAAIGLDGKYIATGVDNIGDGGEINLLLGLGNPLSGGSARAGIYRGELGAGLAYYSGGFGAEVTAYSPQNPKLDAYGYVPVGESVDIVLGVEDATGDAKVTAGAGVKF